MPELPEVETVVRHLRGPLVGRRITGVRVLRETAVAESPAPLKTLLGRRLLRISRRGKFICMELERGLELAVHLRMTGWLGVVPSSETDPYERVRFILDDGAESLVFRDIRTFGRVWCGSHEALENATALGQLGPEPLVIGADAFAARLHERGGRLKSLLLNQEFLAGVGNIYADEALFAAKLHPLTPAARVSREQARRLIAGIRRVLAASIAAGGTSIRTFRGADGKPGLYRVKLRVYGREDQPCLRCGTKIKRIVVGQRGTWFCPHCQRRR
jgi:formamidopyrimidine-DNA glycosylase